MRGPHSLAQHPRALRPGSTWRPVTPLPPLPHTDLLRIPNPNLPFQSSMPLYMLFPLLRTPFLPYVSSVNMFFKPQLNDPYKTKLISDTFNTFSLQEALLRNWKDWEKIFANPMLGKGFVSRTYKEFSKLSNKTNKFKKRAKDLNRHFAQEDV